MKKLLLFSLSFILCTLLAAQEILPVFESGNRSTNVNDDYILVQDYDMLWDYSESVWEHTRNVTYDYNEFHNPIEKFESWTDGRGPYAKTNCFYDADQNLDEEREYRYNDSEWVNNVKNLYNYDGNSNRIQKIRQSWDGEQFENEIKNTYAYDVNNNKIWSMMYYWEDDDWSESQEFDYQYDENGYLYKIESEAWVDDEWRKFQKSIYAYDTSNLLLSIESSLWDPETSSWFHPYHKQLYTYDQDNNRIIFIIQSWNEYDEFWYNLYKTTYYYQLVDYETNVNKRSNINKVIEDLQTTEDDIIIDPGRDDIMLVGIEVMLDSITHTSVGDLEITLLHNGISETIVYHAGGDGDNFITTKLSDQGVDSLANGIAPFYGIYKPENPLSAFLETDPAGTWTLSIYDGVDGNTGTLQSWGINLIYASAASAVDDNYYNESDLVLYPNPAFNKINLESPIFDQQSSVIEIFDLNGRKLIEKQIKSGSESIEIDVSGLATGVYFCQVKLNDKRITKKLIKK